ncbi:phosphoenolpyruvate synthase-related [Holotrichia oblita]|nr:phosphoenolpyruvate synthase-related [Holotrichia oblita]
MSSNLGEVAVRSSASNEDGADYSSAGQYSTVLKVNGEKAFKSAVKDCLASLKSVTAVNYTSYFKSAQSEKMSVVVQQMVEPKFAGVCFTVNPSSEGYMLVEAVKGLGESLVSGTSAAKQYNVPLKQVMLNGSADMNFYENLCAENGLLDVQELRKLCFEAARIELKFGKPMDTEWAIDGVGRLYWLQARTITVNEECSIDEFDPKYDMSSHVITRCNIGEMLPGAVTPLTMSTVVYAIDYGMRNMLAVAGVCKKPNDLPDYSCALGISNNLFLNLYYPYKMEGVIISTSQQNIDFSICGRSLPKAKASFKKSNFFVRLNNMRKYFGFLLSRNKAIVKLKGIADSLQLNEGEIKPEGLYKIIDDNIDINNRSLSLHYITSSHSGAMSSAMYMVIEKKYKEAEKIKSIIAEFLENIDGIESVDILRSLRSLATALLKENPSVAVFSADELAAYIKVCGKEARAAYEYFIKRHGHRAIREAEMRSIGWADNDKAFYEYLKTVIQSGANEETKKPGQNIKDIAKKYGFKRFSKTILLYLTRQSRKGVCNRELSKSLMIKVIDTFKKAYRRLAAMLVKEGALPDEDLIFFLTHKEIGALIYDKDFKLIKKALQRRRLLDEQSALSFDEVYNGKPKASCLTLDGGEQQGVLNGAPISRGVVRGAARVVKSPADAAELKKGEIMVASYTDIGWSPYYCLIGGLVTEVGSALSHGAVVAREYALPLVANVANATRLIQTGDIITLNGTDGSVTLHKRDE